jgi:glycosyltransferase involved in cell wall biosynthesis
MQGVGIYFVEEDRMKKLRIDILCNDGSPLNTCLDDIYGKRNRIGLGGAELALHTVCEALHNNGHRVKLYNSPQTSGGSPYGQYPVDTFLPHEDRDILIIFRSPNHRSMEAKGRKIWWSCDQFTVGNFAEFAPTVDKIITISSYHANHFKTIYDIENTITIDLPVRMQDYEQTVRKIPHRMIYCSIPDRGLSILVSAYCRIQREVPDVSLSITSDYRLWGVGDARNELYIRKFLTMDGVRFLGAIPRMDMVTEQLLADVQSYPCIYNELFCYSIAECQVAGAYPVTSSVGAVETTNMGTQVGGNPADPRWADLYVSTVIDVMTNPHLKEMQRDTQQLAKERFSLDKIMKKWDSVLYD